MTNQILVGVNATPGPPLDTPLLHTVYVKRM